jgi:glucose/arabinose dehydrogenase
VVLCGFAAAVAAAWWTSRRLAAADDLQVTVVARRLDHPWALAFLPDCRMLVSLKAGRVAVLGADGHQAGELRGLPPVVDDGQGGLMDLSLDPDFPRQPWLYWTYSEPGAGTERGLAGTAVARGRLSWPGDSALPPTLQEVQVIYRQTPKVRGSGHFGARLAWDPAGWLFVSLGERQLDQPATPGLDNAQNLTKSLGKIVRLTRTGQAAPGHPNWPLKPGAAPLPEIWSLGHRNPQGLAWDADTGRLWATEHGPQGGDELNLIHPGANYGWPLVSYGCPYGSPVGEACRVAGGVHRPPMVEPVSTWVPRSIAPSGLAVYNGTRFPAWRGHLFLGALAGEALWEVTLKGEQVAGRQAWLQGRHGRVRDVRQGPDGWLYVLTDGPDGQLLRVGPPLAR